MLSKDTKVRYFKSVFKIRWSAIVFSFENMVRIYYEVRLGRQVGNKMSKCFNGRISLDFMLHVVGEYLDCELKEWGVDVLFYKDDSSSNRLKLWNESRKDRNYTKIKFRLTYNHN